MSRGNHPDQPPEESLASQLLGKGLRLFGLSEVQSTREGYKGFDSKDSRGHGSSQQDSLLGSGKDGGSSYQKGPTSRGGYGTSG